MTMGRIVQDTRRLSDARSPIRKGDFVRFAGGYGGDTYQVVGRHADGKLLLVDILDGSKHRAPRDRLVFYEAPTRRGRDQAKPSRDASKSPLIRQIYGAAPKDFRYRTKAGHHVMLPERSGHGMSVTLLERLPVSELRRIVERYQGAEASRDRSRRKVRRR